MRDRSRALNTLMATLLSHEERGESIPCVNSQRGHWWTSEEREELNAAVLACRSCPALAACAAYTDAHPEKAGVWAGVAFVERGRTEVRRRSK